MGIFYRFKHNHHSKMDKNPTHFLGYLVFTNLTMFLVRPHVFEELKKVLVRQTTGRPSEQRYEDISPMSNNSGSDSSESM